MREAGRVVATILRAMVDAAKPGVTTGELDDLAVEMMAKAGVKSAAARSTWTLVSPAS